MAMCSKAVQDFKPVWRLRIYLYLKAFVKYPARRFNFLNLEQGDAAFRVESRVTGNGLINRLVWCVIPRYRIVAFFSGSFEMLGKHLAVTLLRNQHHHLFSSVTTDQNAD